MDPNQEHFQDANQSVTYGNTESTIGPTYSRVQDQADEIRHSVFWANHCASVGMIPKFMNNTNPSMFLLEYEMVAKIYKWTAEQKIHFLYSAFAKNTGAKFYLIGIMETNPNMSWIDFKEDFKRKFNVRYSGHSTMADLIARRQQVNETIESYWYEKKLTIMANAENLLKPENFGELKQIMVSGLTEKLQMDVRSRLIGTNLNSLDELYDLIRESNEYLISGRQATDYFGNPFRDSQRDDSQRQRQPKTRTNQPTDIDNLTRAIDGLRTATMQALNNQNCNICGDTSHLRKDCPELMNDLISGDTEDRA